jgi:hypothetical protein
MTIIIGVFAFVGTILTAGIWSSIHGAERVRRRHRSDRPYAL